MSDEIQWQKQRIHVREADMDAMISRFLRWNLPDDFSPDGGISFYPPPNHMTEHWWPVGTNLFTAEQAKAMIEHMLAIVHE